MSGTCKQGEPYSKLDDLKAGPLMVYLVFGYLVFGMVFLVFGMAYFVFRYFQPGSKLDHLKAGPVDLLDQAEDG